MPQFLCTTMGTADNRDSAEAQQESAEKPVAFYGPGVDLRDH